MINKIELKDSEDYYRLGFIINDKFDRLYNFNNLLDSEYDSIYGYYIDNKLVGFIHINKIYEVMDIVNVVVDINYRHQGIGSELISYVSNLYEDVTSIMLEVNENNKIAIDLYSKNGFYEINRRNNYYGNDTAIIMKRDV